MDSSEMKEFLSGIRGDLLGAHGDDFFTSGLNNVIKHYKEAKNLYTKITIALIVICILVILIKFLVF